MIVALRREIYERRGGQGPISIYGFHASQFVAFGLCALQSAVFLLTEIIPITLHQTLFVYGLHMDRFRKHCCEKKKNHCAVEFPWNNLDRNLRDLLNVKISFSFKVWYDMIYRYKPIWNNSLFSAILLQNVYSLTIFEMFYLLINTFVTLIILYVWRYLYAE